MEKKEQILNLRAEGKTYDEIQEILQCSKGLISYHCGEGQKEKTKNRIKARRNKNYLIQKVENFKIKKLKNGVRDFQRRIGSRLGKAERYTFNYKDVLDKFGINTQCYLTGEPINLITSKNYNIDHIVPPKRGGNNSIDNMGILTKEVNNMKKDLLIDEFVSWCKRILEHNGYSVIKK